MKEDSVTHEDVLQESISPESIPSIAFTPGTIPHESSVLPQLVPLNYIPSKSLPPETTNYESIPHDSELCPIDKCNNVSEIDASEDNCFRDDYRDD